MTEETATFRINKEEFYALWKMNFQRTSHRCLYWLAIAIAVVLTPAILIDGFSLKLVLAIVVGLSVGFFILGIQRLTLYGRAMKVFNESASLREVLTLTVSDDGFLIEQVSGSFRSTWKKMVKWDETHEIMAIYQNRMSAFVIPKDAVDASFLDFIRSKMISSGMSKPGKLRK